MRKSYILSAVLLIAIVFPLLAGAQNINTVAGNGYEGYYGITGQALSVELHWPKGVALDRNGNLYIADYLNNVIRKVTPWGTISNIAGSGFEAGTEEGDYTGDGGPATVAHLWAPTGICVDTNGFVYIADYANNRVRMVDTAGIITTYAGTGIGGYSGDGGAAGAAQLSGPVKVALDTFQNLYIVDQNNNCIRQVNRLTNTIITVAGNGTMAPGYSGDGMLATAAQLDMPADVTTDSTGNLYIADEVNNVIRFVNMTTGNIFTFAGAGSAGFRGDGGPAITAQFFDPIGVALDDSDNLYVSDYGNNRVRAINIYTDTIYTVAGDGNEGYSGDGGPATAAEIWLPEGLATDVKGGVYIADMGNNRIRYLSTPASGITNINTSPVDILVYPNPCQGTFALYMPPGISTQAHVIITNALGEQVKELDTHGNTLSEVKLDEPPGIYFLTATTPNGMWSKQVMIR